MRSAKHFGRQGRASSRARVLAALAGEGTDRIPVDFDFGPFRRQLRQHRIDDPEAHFGVDLKKIWFVPSADAPAEPAAQPASPAPGEPRVGTDQQVANYQCWRYYPQHIDRRNPLVAANSIKDVEAYRLPLVEAESDISRLRQAVAAHHDRGLAVAGQVPQLGGVVFETAYRLRGLDNLLADLQYRPDFAEVLLDHIADAAVKNVRQLVAAGVDIVVLGDDIGTPTSMLISPATWRTWFKGRLKRIIDAARSARPQVAIAYHSDGFYLPVIEDLVEIGVNILNPVQPDCMDPLALRRRFGRALTFWGTVGSACLMPFAAPGAVTREVRRRLETLGESGGLILAAAYDLEDNVPIANVLAFFEGCRP